MKLGEKSTKHFKCTIDKRGTSGITLIALIVTIIVNRVFYDKNIKLRNLVGSNLWFIYTYNRIVIEKDNNSIFLW